MKILQVGFLVFLMVLSTNGLLQVYMPTCASNEIPGVVNYTLANFGHILYGRTILGEIIVPDNPQFCNLDQLDNFTVVQGEYVKKFFMIKRGTCKFTKKILNAQKKGADLVIVYDNQPSTTPNVVMSNDGHGHLINIPSVFISSTDGEKLIKTFQKCSKSMVLKIHFDVFLSKVANLTLWLDVTNRQSFITIRDFYHDYYQIMKNYVNLDVKYKINENCGLEQCQSDDCVSQGRFCLPSEKVIAGVPVPGKEYINQQLREYFLFQILKQKKQEEAWISYMIAFDQALCMEKMDVKQCSYNIMKKYERVQAIEQKVLETYSLINQKKPNALESFIDQAYRSDILFYPEASINGRNFYGLFRAPDIFQMICQSLEQQPKECHSFIKDKSTQRQGQNNTDSIWKTILLIILFMIILFFVVLFIYNRLIKRELNQQMSMEVNKMVEHYVAMTEEKSRSNASMEMK